MKRGEDGILRTVGGIPVGEDATKGAEIAALKQQLAEAEKVCDSYAAENQRLHDRAEAAGDEALERLGRAIMRLPSGYGKGERGQGILEGITGLRERAEAAEAANKRLREALKPFASAFRDQLAHEDRVRRAWTVHIRVSTNDLRRASAALSASGEQT